MRPFTLNWHDDAPTQGQLDYIRRIFRESDQPIPPFTGKTKGEAALWISKYRGCNERKENETTV